MEGEDMTLKARVVAVTGGSGQLGKAVVRAALDAGAEVAVLDRSRPAAPPPAGVLALPGLDLADAEAARQALNTVAEHFGGLDALVNVAGAFHYETLEHGGLEAWDLLYRANLRSAVSASRAALPHLLRRRRGRIVNIGAAAAVAKAAVGIGAYAASKAGVLKLTESLAEELKDRGITVNAVLPSIIDTPANRAAMPDADFSRWVAPQAIADVIVFLLSDRASAVTGAAIPVVGRV
jgi:NAD(P)-dependent dehydrogenase (short-subunit alcohol dehydrogenase family)